MNESTNSSKRYQNDNLNNNNNNNDNNNYKERCDIIKCNKNSFQNRVDENNLYKLNGNIINNSSASTSSSKFANNSSTNTSKTNTNKKNNNTNENNNNQDLSKTIDLTDTSSCNSVCDMNFDDEEFNNNTDENVDDDIEADYEFQLNNSVDTKSSHSVRALCGTKNSNDDDVKQINATQMKRNAQVNNRTSDMKSMRANNDTCSNRTLHNPFASDCISSHKHASNLDSFALESNESKQTHASNKSKIKKHISFESDHEHLNPRRILSNREVLNQRVNDIDAMYRPNEHPTTMREGAIETTSRQKATPIPIKIETRVNSNYDNIFARHNSLTPTDLESTCCDHSSTHFGKNDEPFRPIYATMQPTQSTLPKKISNLKKMNSARQNKRANVSRQVDKVTFNNVEIQHMIRTRAELNPREMSSQPASTSATPIMRTVDRGNVSSLNAGSSSPSSARYKTRPIKHSNTFSTSDCRKYRSNSCSARDHSQESLVYANVEENGRRLRHPRSDYNIRYLNDEFDASFNMHRSTSSSDSMAYLDYAHNQYVPQYSEYYELIRTTSHVPAHSRAHHRKKKRRHRHKQIQFLEMGTKTYSPFVTNQESNVNTLKFKSISNNSLPNGTNGQPEERVTKNPSQVIRINLRNDEQILRNNSVLQDEFQSANNLRQAQQAQEQPNSLQEDLNKPKTEQRTAFKTQPSNLENMSRSASVSVNIVPNRNLKLVHPSSSAQINRLLNARPNEQDSDNVLTEIMHSTNYSDLLSENASIIDSPIHLLMSHHKNKRVLKDKELPVEFKRRFLSENMEQSNNTNGNESRMEIINEDPRDVVIQAHQMPDYHHETSEQSLKTFSSDYFNQESNKTQLNEVQPQRDYKLVDEDLVRHRKDRIDFKRLAALMLAALITFSSVYLFELVSFILQKNNLNILAYRLSTFVTCIGFIVNMMLSNRRSKKSSQLSMDNNSINLANNDNTFNYFDLFKNNQDKDLDSLNDDDGFILHYQPQNNTQSSSYLLNKNLLQVRLVHKLKHFFALSARFNICWFVLSIMLVHLWILASYVLSYLNWMNLLPVLNVYQTSMSLHIFLQILVASIGGFALAIFIRFIILCLFEMSCSNMLSAMQKLFECDSLYEKESKDYIIAKFLSEQRALIKRYQNSTFKLIVGISFYCFMVVGFVFQLIYVIGETSINKVFDQVCLDTLNKTEQFEFCPISIVKEDFSNWKTELIRKKLTVSPLKVLKSNKNAVNTVNEQLDANENQFSIEQIYLVLISISFVLFFVAIVIPVILLSTSKTTNKSSRANQEKRNDNEQGRFLEDSEEKFYTDTEKPVKSPKKYVFSLHTLMSFVFFHGLMKTILFYELNRWYSGCLNGISHLNMLLLFYSLSSFVSIFCLYILIVVCNLKRNLLFILAFFQQATLLILIFYWEPSKAKDSSSNYIDYVYFICYAICDKLWLFHNLKNLFKKSYQLNKSPYVVLLYAYGMFNLGSFVGYAGSVYFCFTFKIYSTFFILILFNIVYFVSELVINIKS